MKKFECNDCGGHCLVTIYRDYITPCSCLRDKNHADWHEVKETVIDYSQWPKLTAKVFDRLDCPKWANYAAVNKSGRGFYFRSEPEKTDSIWKLPPDHKMTNIGKFDPSDWANSLIKRPPKEELPDWVKEGAVGYDNGMKDYFKVTNVREKWIDIEELDDGTAAMYSYADMQNCSEARKRPFNAEELKELVGKMIKNGPGTHLVIGCDNVFENAWVVYVKDAMFSGSDLMKYEYTIDGKPCHKYEHLNDKGEWVK